MNRLGGIMAARNGVRKLATDDFEEEAPVAKFSTFGDASASAGGKPGVNATSDISATYSGAEATGAAGQGQAKWVQIAAAAASAIGSMMSQRSANKQSEKQTEEDREFEREQAMRARAQQLQDRRYKEDTAGNYAGFYEGPAIEGRPEKTDVAAVLAAETAAYEASKPKTPPKKKKKKRSLLSRIHSTFLKPSLQPHKEWNK